jgi:hypothetical protein
MTQRYPTYFDGVVAGAPAMRTGHSNLADTQHHRRFESHRPEKARTEDPSRAARYRTAIVARSLQRSWRFATLATVLRTA